jgi:hypothetical protein
MIVGIDYNDDGSRSIAKILYQGLWDENIVQDYAKEMKEHDDEVYIVDLNPNCTDFINEIVTKGCRI